MIHLRFSTRARVPLGRLGYNGTFPRITQQYASGPVKTPSPTINFTVKTGLQVKNLPRLCRRAAHNMQ